MNLEQTLTDELASVAGGIDVPPPPALAAVAQEAEHRRSRSRLRWTATTLLAAAAVVAAIVAGNQIGRPDAAPQPTQPSQSPTPTPTPTPTPSAPATRAFPMGAAPRIPYVVGNRLYLGNKPQPGSYMDVRTVGRTSLADWAGPGAGGPPVIFRDGRKVAVLSKAVGAARLSTDGTMVAWFEAYGGTDHLVLLEVTSGIELGRISADARGVNPDFYARLDPRSVADDGTVVYTTDDHTYFSWHPGRTPVRVRVPDVQAPPDGFASGASYVVLSPKGAWGGWVTDRYGHDPESPESNGIDGVTFQKRGDPQTRFTVTLPEGGSTSQLAWETDTDVLVDFIVEGSGAWDQYLRCHVLTGRCEYAPTPANPTLVASPAN